jgi:hypothetical protein
MQPRGRSEARASRRELETTKLDERRTRRSVLVDAEFFAQRTKVRRSNAYSTAVVGGDPPEIGSSRRLRIPASRVGFAPRKKSSLHPRLAVSRPARILHIDPV